MDISFQEFVQETATVTTIDELVGLYLQKVHTLGYDKMIFCLLSEHTHIGLSAGVGYLNNYPEDWMKFYMEQGFDEIDPVISYCRESIGTFTWDEMSKALKLTNKQRACLTMGEKEAQLYNGTCSPIWGPHSFSGIGLATSETHDACDARPETLDLIHAYSNHFYLIFQRLHKGSLCPNSEDARNLFLSWQEKEILTWVAQGKSNSVISDIVMTSEANVKYHLKNIFRKLEAHDRVVACTKAIALGLINP